MAPLLLTAIFWWALWTDASDKKNESEAIAAILGSQSNKDHFPRYYCRWKVTSAHAKSVPEAWAGQYENTRSCSMSLAYDAPTEKKERFQCITSEPDARLATKQNGFMVPTVEYLAFTELRMTENSLVIMRGNWNVSAMRSKGYWNHRDEPTPFAMGDMYRDLEANSPFTLLREYQLGKANLQSNGLIMREGKSYVHARLSRHYGDWNFYFDPHMGFLPFECEESYRGQDAKYSLRHVARVLAAQSFDEHRWFPKHIVCLRLPQQDGGIVSVLDMSVEELRLDHEVAAEDFQVDLPAGMTMKRDHPE